MNRKGFSLLELIIVLILLGLSISLITPSLSQFSKSVELKAAAKKVAAVLRHCRSEAVNKGKVYQVLFDSTLMEVKVQSFEWTEDQEGGDPQKAKGVQKAFTLPLGIQMKELKIESNQYPSDRPSIEFYPNGGSNGGDIHLEMQNHKGYRIKVHFLTGNVAIERV